MAYIITSKTRSRIMSQPKERKKLMTDRRLKSLDKHGVETVTPINSMSELEVHEDMDKSGSGVKEVMDATKAINEKKTKEKQKQRLQSPQHQKTVKDRIEKLKDRDRKNGLPNKASKQKKRGK